MPLWSPLGMHSPIANGRRSHSVLIQAPESGSNPDGDVSPIWTDRLPRWQVAIAPATHATEQLAGVTSTGSASHIVIGPYRTDVTLTTRLLVDGSRPFNIVSRIDPEERHRELVLLCKELIS